MLNKSVGNMYPWVSHTHAHLGGECPHKCKYCYVEGQGDKRPENFSGPLRLLEEEFSVCYDRRTLEKAGGIWPGVIFIEHCNDMFCEDVSPEFIRRILAHCNTFPENEYVFQTKNPLRYARVSGYPENSIFGCTIETNRVIPGMSTAPDPEKRAWAMRVLDQPRKFITIEPVLDFDVDILAEWIADIRPEFLNLGADSKNHGLPEPSVEKIMALVDKLKEYGIELREKHNLERLKPK
jgi:DNA repair photolyase